MNQEKEMTQIVSPAGEYLAPKVKVKKLRCRRVICLSPTGGTEDSTEGNTDGWFNG